MKCFQELTEKREVRESARKSPRDERTTIRFCNPDKESFLPRYRLPEGFVPLKPAGKGRKRR